MPASTLHKSAQQEAPDAYIFHVQEHKPKHACTKKIHAPQLACSKRGVHLSCAHPRDARGGHLMRALARYARRPLCVHTKMHASPSYAHPRHTRVVPFLHAPKMAAPTGTCAKDARVAL